MGERTQPERGKTSSELFVRSGTLAAQVRPPIVAFNNSSDVSQKQNT